MNKQGTIYTTDVLVVGGGMAGCMAAIHARKEGAQTLLIDKGYVSSSGQTPYADSFCIFDPAMGDDMDEWLAAIAKGGDYVNKRDWTEAVLAGTYDLYQELSSYGIEFHRDEAGQLVREVGGVAPLTTCFLKEKMKSCITLRQQVLRHGATILDRTMVTDLIVVDGKVCGAVAMTVKGGDFVIVHAKSVILASGASSLKCTGWPNSALTSDGDMMAYRAGASLTGKEYNDVHTTATMHPTYVGPSFLRKGLAGPPPAIYENAKGETFQAPTLFHLAPEFEAHRGNAPIKWTGRKGPKDDPSRVITTGATAGMSTHKSEGIWPVGVEGATELPGLYAAGDALGVMLCGAAYSAAGIALAGSGVMGTIAAKAAARHCIGLEIPEITEEHIAPLRNRLYAPTLRQGGFSPDWVLQLLNNLMVPYFILYVKNEARLTATLEMVTFYRQHLVPKIMAADAHQLRLALECANLVVNCEMKLRTSLYRKESRGTHYRTDYPQRDDEKGLCWVRIRDNQGTIELFDEAIPQAWHPDPALTPEEKYLYQFPNLKEEEDATHGYF